MFVSIQCETTFNIIYFCHACYSCIFEFGFIWMKWLNIICHMILHPYYKNDMIILNDSTWKFAFLFYNKFAFKVCS